MRVTRFDALGDVRVAATSHYLPARVVSTAELFAGEAATDGPPPQVRERLTARRDARARRDFKRSDEIRDEIARLGWLVEDTPAGPRLTPKGR